MSVRVSYKKQILVSVMLFLTILAVIEVAARTIEYNYTNQCNIIGNPVFASVGTKMQEQLCEDYNNLVHEEKIIRQIQPNQHLNTININSLGFRGPEFTKEKPENTFRIIMVGGSTTFGMGATSDNTTIPAYLQKKFDDLILDKKVQVINAGIIAQQSNAEVYDIKNRLVSYNPDLIIVYDGYNDSFYVGVGEITVSKSVSNITSTNSIKDFIKQNLNFYRTPFVIYQLGWDRFQASSLTGDVITKNTEAWNNRWKNLCEFGKGEGFDTIVTIQPILGTGNRHLFPTEEHIAKDFKQVKTREIEAELAKSLTDLNPSCTKTADLRNVFDNTTQPIFYSGAHITDYGNEIVAQKLFELSLPVILEKIQN